MKPLRFIAEEYQLQYTRPNEGKIAKSTDFIHKHEIPRIVLFVVKHKEIIVFYLFIGVPAVVDE